MRVLGVFENLAGICVCLISLEETTSEPPREDPPVFSDSGICRFQVDEMRAMEKRPLSPGPVPSGAAGGPWSRPPERPGLVIRWFRDMELGS